MGAPGWAGQLAGLILVSGLAAGCFLNSLHGHFVFDDAVAILRNRNVDPVNPVDGIWVDDFWGSPLAQNSSHKSFRPLTTYTFRLNAWIAGEAWQENSAAWGFHLVNVALHALNSALFLALCLQFQHLTEAVGSGLIFAAHPIHTEAVASIVGRAELLSGFWFLWALLLYRWHLGAAPGVDGSNSTTRMLLGASALFLSMLSVWLALFSKEQGITCAGVCLLMELLHFRETLKQPVVFCSSVLRFWLVAASSGVALIFRLSLNQSQKPQFPQAENPASFHSDPQVRVLTYIYLAFRHAKLLLVPFPLCHDYSHDSIPLIQDISDPRIIFAAVVLTSVLVVLLAVVFCTVTGRCRHVWSFAVGITVLSFLPSSNLFFPVGFVIAERVLYIPSIGVAMLISSGLSTLVRWTTFRGVANLLLISVVVVACGVATVQRNIAWRSASNLWSGSMKLYPSNPKNHYGLGHALVEDGKLTEGIRFLQQATFLRPDYVEAYYNLGTSLHENADVLAGSEKGSQRLLENARDAFRWAVHFAPTHVSAQFNLGTTEHSLRNFPVAEVQLNKAVALDPAHADAYYNLGAALWYQGKLPEAVQAYQKVIMLKPSKADAYYSTGLSLGAMGKNSEAADYFLRALQANTTHVDSLFNLGVSMAMQRQFETAFRLFTTVRRLKPDRSEARDRALLCRQLIKQSKS